MIYKTDTPFIEVDAIPLSDLIIECGIQLMNVHLIKLDIEGAEIEVLTQFILSGGRPKQILVEFDELNKPSSKGFARIETVYELLVNNGYKCIYTDGQADFLFILV